MPVTPISSIAVFSTSKLLCLQRMETFVIFTSEAGTLSLRTTTGTASSTETFGVSTATVGTASTDVSREVTGMKSA